MKAARTKLAFPLDYPTLAQARQGAALVAPAAGVLKVGLELFVREGPPAVALGQELDCDIFLDLKLLDIPETVRRAVASASALGVRYLTVHASGGRHMLEAAQDSASRENRGLQLLAVTQLTSMDDHDLLEIGVREASAEHVRRLAHLAHSSGIRGFVCSPREVPMLREALGPDVILATPGIRPLDAEAGDQKRIATPGEAIRAGANLLVVGRPIRDSRDPRAAAEAILAEIEEAS